MRTCTKPSAGSSRRKRCLFRSHSMIWPSSDAESSVLKDRVTARTETGLRWPKRDACGCNSTDFALAWNDHIETVQSVPAVTNVRESANRAHDNCPIWSCSKCPRICVNVSYARSRIEPTRIVPSYYPMSRTGHCHPRSPIQDTCRTSAGYSTGTVRRKASGPASSRATTLVHGSL